MLLQPYSKVYPPNLVDATEKMLSEIYDNHQLNIDETALSSAIDKYLKATCPYQEEEAKTTVADILQTAVKSKIDPVIKQYCSETPKLVCSPKIYESFCDYVLNEIIWNLESVYDTKKLLILFYLIGVTIR